jgi:protein tyrosine phosphatase (PTP) superfamily phosphohydrolase (DUF442 family)
MEDGTMRKNRILFNLSLLFLATLMGLYFLGVFDDSSGGKSITPTQTSKDINKIGGGEPQPLLESVGGSLPIGIVPPDVNPDDVEISSETGIAVLVRQRPGIENSQLPPITMLPQGGHPDDVKISPETGLATLLRHRPETENSQPPPMPMLPPGVHPNDVKISPETGAAILLRQRPNTEYSQPPPTVMIPPDVRPSDIEILPGTGAVILKQLRPDTAR